MACRDHGSHLVQGVHFASGPMTPALTGLEVQQGRADEPVMTSVIRPRRGGQCGALFLGAEVEVGMDSEDTCFPSPDTSDTPGVSEPPHWVSASGKRVASFLFSQSNLHSTRA